MLPRGGQVQFSSKFYFVVVEEKERGPVFSSCAPTLRFARVASLSHVRNGRGQIAKSGAISPQGILRQAGPLNRPQQINRLSSGMRHHSCSGT